MTIIFSRFLLKLTTDLRWQSAYIAAITKDKIHKRVIKMKLHKNTDWISIEQQYRAGVRSLRDIGAEFGITEGAIRKKARKEDWVRDLSEKIKFKAQELVCKMEVHNTVIRQHKTGQKS
jgi:hypothetical protein